MKNRRTALTIGLALALSIVLTVGFMKSDAAALVPGAYPFEGNIVAVTYIEGNNIMRVSLEQARIQRPGERYFIAGRVVYSNKSKSMVGCTVWIPENLVMSIVEFESIEKMTKAQPEPLPLPTPIFIK
jgi:hypothetical protein